MNNRRRKLNRLPGFDYSQPGKYFVTLCTKDRTHWFGTVKNEKMVLNQFGSIAQHVWRQIPNYYNNVSIDEFIIMPNHIHGIVIVHGDNKIRDNGAQPTSVGTGHCPVPTDVGFSPCLDANYASQYTKPKQGLLSTIIKSYKNIVTKKFRSLFPNTYFNWQRSFYDHIIRSESVYWQIKYYIKQNPKKWWRDRNNI